MIKFNRKSPTILYLHGFKSHPGDSIQSILEEDGFKVEAPDLTAPNNPEVIMKDILKISKNVDIVLGFSMGGFWASCIPGKTKKIFINPAYYFPYILLHKTGDRRLFQEYMKIAGKYQFQDSPVDSMLLYGAKDKTQPLLTFQTFYNGKTIEGLRGHVPEEFELKRFIYPELI